VQTAVTNIEDRIIEELVGYEASDQRAIDQKMLDIDGTPDKSSLGANAILGVSLAVAKAAAASAELSLFRYLGGPNAHLLPVPMMNILNGGAHADSNVDIQEFMIAPIGAPTVPRGAAHAGRGLPRAEVGAQEEGPVDRPRATRAASRPNLPANVRALDLIGGGGAGGRAEPRHRHRARPRRGRHRVLRRRGYTFEGAPKSSDDMIAYYRGLVDAYPIVSIEDPWPRTTGAGWKALTAALGDRIQIVGDDLFVTNPERIARGIAERSRQRGAGQVNQIAR
jgi:enolase